MSFSIPSTGARSELLSTGLRDNGSLEVPPDGPGAPASWYNQSPTPGERRPSVLLGHLNATDGGPGIFAGLRNLTTGDTIEVLREDGTTATFTFDRGGQYPQERISQPDRLWQHRGLRLAHDHLRRVQPGLEEHSTPGTPACLDRSNSASDELTGLHPSPEHLQQIRSHEDRIARHTNTHSLSVAITARTQGSSTGRTIW
uniref:sortase domain-containing protein n=1 Tax=Arthrobacter sedimenti TaxID=2694931 RepID=UPI002D7E4C6F|nr:sortase [Arthrobacter sedimenti]